MRLYTLHATWEGCGTTYVHSQNLPSFRNNWKKTCFDKRACSIGCNILCWKNFFAFAAPLNHYTIYTFIFFSSHRHRAMCAIERRDRPPNYPPDGGRGEWAICQGKKGRRREGMVSVRYGESVWWRWWWWCDGLGGWKVGDT